jgi:hypothetical protein
MHEIRFLQRSGTTIQDDVANAMEFLKREGIVADNQWHRAFQLLVAENFDVF